MQGIMGIGHRNSLILLSIISMAIPYLMASSPAATARSSALRVTIHIAAVGMALGALLDFAPSSLRNSVFTTALAVVLQYWAFWKLERNFEMQYKRPPILRLWTPISGTEWKDRVMSGTCALIGLGSILLIYGAAELPPA